MCRLDIFVGFKSVLFLVNILQQYRRVHVSAKKSRMIGNCIIGAWWDHFKHWHLRHPEPLNQRSHFITTGFGHRRLLNCKASSCLMPAQIIFHHHRMCFIWVLDNSIYNYFIFIYIYIDLIYTIICYFQQHHVF